MISLIAGVGDVFRFFGQLINSLPAVFYSPWIVLLWYYASHRYDASAPEVTYA